MRKRRFERFLRIDFKIEAKGDNLRCMMSCVEVTRESITRLLQNEAFEKAKVKITEKHRREWILLGKDGEGAVETIWHIK